MFEWLQISPATLIAIITGGSGALVGMIAVITAIYSAKKAKKEYQITKEGVVDGFKQAVIPSKVQLDVSTSIIKTLNTAFPQLTEELKKQISPLISATCLILRILANTAAANKLSEEEKLQVQQIYNYLHEITVTVAI